MEKSYEDFKHEIAKKAGYASWLELVKATNGVTEHFTNQAAELYGRYCYEKGVDEKFMKIDAIYNVGWNEALNYAVDNAELTGQIYLDANSILKGLKK